MIAKKAQKSGGFGGRVDYIIEEQASREQRGKFLDCSSDLSSCMPIADGEGINGKEIARMMQEQASKNTRVSKACYHQIFSFPEGERPSDEVLQDISQEFAKEFGFTQWLSVKHEDTKKLHIHFVGNTVNNQGKVSVNDSNDYYRLNDFVKIMNEKHDLKRVGTIKERGETSENTQIQRLQKIIDKAILTEGVKDIKSLQNQLLKSGVKSFTQRGITFIDKHSGVQFKGSKLGKTYSLKALEKRISEKDVSKEIKIDPHQALKTFLETAALQSKNMEDFSNRLGKNGIDSSNLNSQLNFTVEGQRLNETQLTEDYALKNIRFNLNKPTWTSRVFEKERLKTALDKSISEKPGEGLQTFENITENLRKEGWQIATENKSFTNPKNELVAYTQLSFKSKEGMVINDSELKGKETTTNPYGMNGIVKEIEKINQSTLKTDVKKDELSELIKQAAVKAHDLDEFTMLLKTEGVEFSLKTFQNKETNETVETQRFKKDGAIYTSKEIGEDLSLDNLRYNISSRSNGFIPRETLKGWLINDIRESLSEDNVKDALTITQLNEKLESKNWKIETNQRYFKNKEGSFVPYQQFKYVSLNNPDKFMYDYELKEKDEKVNDFSAKNVNAIIDKNTATLVRNSLINSLDSSKSHMDLAYKMYADSGILIDVANRSFSSNNKTINYREYVFHVPTTPQETLSKDDFNNEKWKLLEDAHKNNYKHISLSDINKANVGSKITNADFSEIYKENRGDVANGVNEGNNQEFEPEQQDTFLQDLKKIVMGKTTQSGHAGTSKDKGADDIRSLEEKRKDELRRKGRTI